MTSDLPPELTPEESVALKDFASSLIAGRRLFKAAAYLFGGISVIVVIAYHMFGIWQEWRNLRGGTH